MGAVKVHVSKTSGKADNERYAALLLAHMEKTDDPQTAAFKKVLDEWRMKGVKKTT